MGSERVDEGINEQAGKVLKRRGILAAAGAVVAGIVAKQVSEPVAATDYNAGWYYHAVDPFSTNYIFWSDGRSLASTENVIGLRADGRGTYQGIYAVGG